MEPDIARARPVVEADDQPAEPRTGQLHPETRVGARNVGIDGSWPSASSMRGEVVEAAVAATRPYNRSGPGILPAVTLHGPNTTATGGVYRPGLCWRSSVRPGTAALPPETGREPRAVPSCVVRSTES